MFCEAQCKRITNKKEIMNTFNHTSVFLEAFLKTPEWFPTIYHWKHFFNGYEV